MLANSKLFFLFFINTKCLHQSQIVSKSSAPVKKNFISKLEFNNI